MAATTARPNGAKSDFLITNRRREEDARNRMRETTQYYARADMKSLFEESTALKIQRKHVFRKFNELKATADSKLEERRARLRELYRQDEERYRQCLVLKEDTRESRVDAMRKRMTELRENRERERKVVVEQKLLQRWRKECDELRTLESKVLEKKVAVARAVQLQEHEERKELERQEKKHYDDLWEQDRLKKIVREEEDRAHQKAINEETMIVLEQQLQSLRLQTRHERELKQEEARLMQEAHEARLLEDQHMRERKLQEQRIICQDLDSFNKTRAYHRQKEVQEALDADMRLLSEFLKLDRVEKEAKQKRREELRQEMQMYREHLQKQKEIEISREIELEKWYASEQERLWKLRSEKWRKEQAARDRLMKEVIQGRRDQLQYALECNHQAQEQVRLEKIQLEKQIQETKANEATERAKHTKIKREYSHVLTEQMEAAERKRADERRRAELEDAAEKLARQKYDELVLHELNRVVKS